MFGRKRKQEEENLGLSAPYVSPSISATPNPTPTPTQSTPIPTQPMPAAGAMPATVPAMLSQILGGNGPIGELIAEIKADPQGFRDRMMQQAQAAGVSTYVLNTQSLGSQQPQHVDVVEELTKAADLHDKGALTDAEFEALKKKLLAES
jgi:putative oligomerization/nucleic acid binding protein